MGAPLLLVTTALPSLLSPRDPWDRGRMHPNLGRLLQTRHVSSVERMAAAGVPWAADNDCFQLDARRYDAMLDHIKGVPGCRFVTVPDVVATVASSGSSGGENGLATASRGRE